MFKRVFLIACICSFSLAGYSKPVTTQIIKNIYRDVIMVSVGKISPVILLQPIQKSPVIKTINAFQDHVFNHSVEKIYLHLDKPYYAAGEYMYFREYLTDIHLSQENEESRKIYVELSNAEMKLIRSVLLYSEETEYAGQIMLPDSLPAANYHLRAYTNWMRNAGEDYFYHRDIYIGNTATQKQEAFLQNFDYQVTFFPEGGRLLAGFSNKFAFKSLGNDGFSADITGVVFDEGKNEILRFNSLQFGIGAFDFMPEKDKTYKATVQSGGLEKEYTLPATNEGLAQLMKRLLIRVF